MLTQTETGSTPPAAATAKKQKPSYMSKADQEVRKLQEQGEHIIPWQAFMRCVRMISFKIDSEKIWSHKAIQALQCAAEEELSKIFQHSLLTCRHAKRETIKQEDMRVVMEVSGRNLDWGYVASLQKQEHFTTMSGCGKGGKGLGKGGDKAHREELRHSIQVITKPAICRLARRGGVRRISGLVYEETRRVLKVFLENVICDSILYTEHKNCKTITVIDVNRALKRRGRTVYGLDG